MPEFFQARLAGLGLLAVTAGTLLAGCGSPAVNLTHTASTPTASATSAPTTAPAPTPTIAPTQSATPPAVSPVSDQAVVSGKCTPGLYDQTTGTFYLISASQMSGTSPGDTVYEAYQMTLTNDGSTAAEITGFSAVFYDFSRRETTSDTENFDGPTFLEPNQSLTWTEEPWGSYALGQGSARGPFTEGSEGAIDSAATCQLVQWTHP
jgi:hypothetical protein